MIPVFISFAQRFPHRLASHVSTVEGDVVIPLSQMVHSPWTGHQFKNRVYIYFDLDRVRRVERDRLALSGREVFYV